MKDLVSAEQNQRAVKAGSRKSEEQNKLWKKEEN